MIVYHKISYGQFSQTSLRIRTRLLLSNNCTNTLPKPKTTISHTILELVARTHSQRFCKPSQFFFNSNIDTPISVLLNRISTRSSSIHWGHRGRVFDRFALIFGSIVMTNNWLELSMNSLLLKRGVWSTIASDGLLRLKQREDSKTVWDIVAMECR